MTVWDNLVGQRRVVETLQRAVAGDLQHAWLFTGPTRSRPHNAPTALAPVPQNGWDGSVCQFRLCPVLQHFLGRPGSPCRLIRIKPWM